MRAAPFYCPYCGEEAIEPLGEGRVFYCNSCDRSFELAFLGVGEVRR